jgi:hypothetical protein
MTPKTTASASLDEVLASYATKAADFNAEVLQSFINEYPQYAEPLRRYAQVQLSSVSATPEEVDQEATPDHEMLPMQSKLLLRMQQLRRELSAGDIKDAANKLDTLKGRSIQAAARAVFGDTEAGQAALFLCVVEAPGVKDAPEWFNDSLGAYLDCKSAAIPPAIIQRHSGSGRISLQKFSAMNRPKNSQPRLWSDAVEETITDPAIKTRLLTKK